MTLMCWGCDRQTPAGEWVELRLDDLRFYGGKKLRILKHIKCKKRTAFFATAGVTGSRLQPAH